MFFIQRQLIEDKCGCVTEVLAYFYLNPQSACFNSIKNSIGNSPNQLK